MSIDPPPDPAHRPTGTEHARRGRGVGGTRTSRTWTVAVLFLLVLVPLVIFLTQNTAQVRVSFVSLHGRMPLGVAMLLSAVGGALLVSLAAAARIWQLRRMNRHR
ncbi:MAG TPA: lipopolysaccharide assembly protein LapA domain-containing protein [Mycobacteriales bacterium]